MHRSVLLENWEPGCQPGNQRIYNQSEKRKIVRADIKDGRAHKNQVKLRINSEISKYNLPGTENKVQTQVI